MIASLSAAESRLERSLADLAPSILSEGALLALDCPLPGGARPKLSAVARASKLDARSCLIVAHDPRDAPFVAKALEASPLGLSLRRDGPRCEARLPPTTSESRARLALRAGALHQEALAAIRAARKAFLSEVDGAVGPGFPLDAASRLRGQGEAARALAEGRCSKLAADAKRRLVGAGP